MAKGVTFTKESAARIGVVVRAAEAEPRNLLPGPRQPLQRREPVIIAEIDSPGTGIGLYSATQVRWTGTEFVTLVGARTWGGDLHEINDDTAVEVGTFVRVFPVGKEGGGIQWTFSVGADPVKESIERDDSDGVIHLVNDELVPANDPSMYGFDSLDSPTKEFKLFEQRTFLSAMRLNDTTNEIEVQSFTGFVFKPSSPGPFVGIISDPTDVLDPVTTGLVLLLHMNGIDEATDFPDTGCLAHTVVANGSVQIDTSIKKFGSAGGLFASATSDFLKIANSQAWNVAAADFTIDGFFNSTIFPPTPANNVYRLFTVASSNSRGAGDYSIDVVINNVAGVLEIAFNASDGTNEFLTPGFIITSLFDGANHHWAAVRDGATLRLFVDGSQVTSVAIGAASLLFNGSLTLQIGTAFNGTLSNYTGTMDEIRLVKGEALNNGTSFPVPSSEYADCGG